MIKSRIYKSPVKKEFVKIPNELFASELSLQAFGLLCFLLHLPSNFSVRKTKLHEKFKNGRDATLSAFNELINFGYITQHQERLQKGMITYWYEISPTVTVKPSTVEPHTGKFNKIYTRFLLEQECQQYEGIYGKEMILQFVRFYTKPHDSGGLMINKTKRFILKERLQKFSKNSNAYKKYSKTKAHAPKKQELLVGASKLYGKKETAEKK